MIKNERQYRITKAQADRFERAIAELSTSTGTTSILEQAQIDGIESQLADLKEELAEYESLKDGGSRVFKSDSIEGLPQSLIKARIAAGMTQKELALHLGLKEQQIQRYEATGYASASFARIRLVVEALGVNVREEISLADMRR